MIVRYFKNSFPGSKIVCADSSPYAPALYDGDFQEIVPRVDEAGYLDAILELCKKYAIRGVISLIDPELELLARYNKLFQAIGAFPMISSLEAINNCFNKAEFAVTLNAIGVDGPITYDRFDRLEEALNQGRLTFPLMVKPAFGSASVGLVKAESVNECRMLFERYQGIIAQEWIDFDEYGIDCYVDMISGRLASMFIKQKLLMRAGETDKAISSKNAIVRDAVIRFLESYPHRIAGTIDIDAFFDGERCLISEVNPRFGGGYPHAYACGIDFPKMYRHNLQGLENPPFEGLDYVEGIAMMKYSDITIMESEHLAQ